MSQHTPKGELSLASVNQKFDHFFPVHGNKPAPRKAIPKHSVVFVHGIPFAFTGEYDAPDKSVGYAGGYTLEKVWIDGDPEAHDIADFLSASTKELIEGLAIEGAIQAEVDAKMDAAESRRQAAKDNQLDQRRK